MRQSLVTLFAALAATAAVTAPVKADISGAGATFPYPLYAKWADTYKKDTGVGLNYQSIGSGGGIKQIEANTVTFGASDKPLPGEELEKNGLVQFPTVMGGIVPVVNLDGIKPGDIVLDGPTIAKIYLGDIKTWNDPAIVKLNPGLKLPSDAIAVVFRSDGSGTTFVWTNYLSKVERRLQVEDRLEHVRSVPRRHRRQGQRGRRQQRDADEGLDRLRRIRVCQAEQALLHEARQQGRQDRCTGQGGLPGRCCQCRLGSVRRAWASS